MPATRTTHEQDVRKFVAEFPTANTRYLLSLAVSGEISWSDAARIAGRALAAAMDEVAAS